MNVTINVTQDDIDKGRARNVLCCPVALALRRATGKGWTVSAMSVSLYKTRSGIRLPQVAVDFIAHFDDFPDGAKFSFGLDIPDQFAEATP